MKRVYLNNLFIHAKNIFMFDILEDFFVGVLGFV